MAIAGAGKSEGGRKRPRSGLARAGTLCLFVAGIFAPDAGHAAPGRVVSINVCTDQLAMLLAEKDQLVSVSAFATDPDMSVMHEAAERYIPNRARAEEIYLMRPDLVLAGTFTARATLEMLERLDVPVAVFPPATSLDGIRGDIIRMGALLGQPKRAGDLVDAFDAGLAAIEPAESSHTAAIYEANSYLVGTGTLADAVLEAAGLDNIADDLGIVGTARLPLELLVMNAPDLIIADIGLGGEGGRSLDNIRHPAFRAVAEGRSGISVPGRYWTCGGPFTLEAVRMLADAARALDRDPRS